MNDVETVEVTYEDAVLDLVDGIHEFDTDWQGMISVGASGLTAGAFPINPPKSWFTNPKLTDLTPLTVDSSGQVYGHIAAWHTSHIGMAGGVRPPKSKSNYAYFRTGTVECDDGTFENVGQITLAGGHAALDASVAKAVAHYDDTNSAVMDVAAGEDKYGIWVAGALRPDVTPEQIRSIRASSVSGDWRPIGGRLELVAVCSVNCPGFPIPRARVASGAPIALVAAGTEPLVEKALNMRIDRSVDEGVRAAVDIFRDRLEHLENTLLADESGPLATDEAEALRQRVRGDRQPTQPQEGPPVAELRRRVHGDAGLPPEDGAWEDGLGMEVTLAAALRSKVHG
jgi:hypothetical protein